MTNFIPFPVGRFTEAEWRTAYRFCLDEADAAREAASNASITEDEAGRISISECDLAYLSFVSRGLADRVEAFRREVLRRRFIPLDDRGIAESPGRS